MPTLDELPLPSRDYLVLHAACAKAAHLSGAAEYIDRMDPDLDETFVLAEDGTSAARCTVEEIVEILFFLIGMHLHCTLVIYIDERNTRFYTFRQIGRWLYEWDLPSIRRAEIRESSFYFLISLSTGITRTSSPSATSESSTATASHHCELSRRESSINTRCRLFTIRTEPETSCPFNQLLTTSLAPTLPAASPLHSY